MIENNYQIGTIENLKIKNQKSKIKIKEVIIKHAKLVYDRKGDHGIIEFRKHLAMYLKGLSNAKELRVDAVIVESISDVKKIIDRIND